MKHARIIAVLLAAVALALIIGCASDNENTVIADASGTGIKGTTGADVSSGTPTPTVWIGLLRFLCIVHPSSAPSLIYYSQRSATFNAEAKDSTFILIDKGTKGKVSVEPGKIVSVPGITVASGSSTVNVSADTSVDSGSTNEASTK